MRGAPTHVAITLLLCLAAPGAARAQSIESGSSLFEQARFEESQRIFDQLLASGDTSTGDLATAHLYVAAVAHMARRSSDAERHVRFAAAIDPDVEPPPGLPLQLVELLEGLVASASPLTVSLAAPECPMAGAPVGLLLSVVGGPEGLVSAVSIRCGVASRLWEETVAGHGTTQLTVPPHVVAGDELACVAVARSAEGAVVRRVPVEVSLCSDVAGDPSEQDTGTVPPGGGDQRRRSPWVWVGVSAGVVAVAAAITLGVVLGTAPQDARFGDVTLEGP